MVGSYDNGVKDGVFIFKGNDFIKEVLYDKNEIKEIKTWGVVETMITTRK